MLHAEGSLSLFWQLLTINTQRMHMIPVPCVLLAWFVWPNQFSVHQMLTACVVRWLNYVMFARSELAVQGEGGI